MTNESDSATCEAPVPGVMCPICGSTFAGFAEFGVVKRKNAQCLSCESLERHRLLWKYLHDKTDLFRVKEPRRLLHFAPEKVFYNFFSKHPNIEYVPCDLYPDVYNYRGTVKIRQISITDISFPDNYFDVVLCNHVLEHIPDDRRAMRELFRVIKKSGWGIFQVPVDYNRGTTYEDSSITSSEDRQKAFGQSDHVRWYGRDYKDRLNSVGFDVTEDDYVKGFQPADLFKLGLKPSELIYKCSKP